MIDAVPRAAIVAELKACRLESGEFSIRYDEELQTTIVLVKRATKVDASNFVCIRQALSGKADIDFEDEQLGDTYRAFDEEIGRTEGRAIAHAWFQQRGLLDKLPSFADGEASSSVTAKLERFCGLEPGSAFEERYSGQVSMRRDFTTEPPKPGAKCLFFALAAVDTEKLGIKFGFIGNEAASERTEK